MRGGPPPHLAKKKKAKKSKLKKKAAAGSAAGFARDGAATTPTTATRKLTEEEGRDAHMATVRSSVEQHAPGLLDQLAARGYGIVDGFLPEATVQAMRAECEGLRKGGTMVASQSTRWDETSGEVQTYQKSNVLSTNVAGGEAYHLSPRLVEYCVSLVSALPPLVNARFASTQLSSQIHTNKLAVCLGDGSQYAKHYDNSGGGDMRKLTVLIYLNDAWREENGGCFRMFTDGDADHSADKVATAGASTHGLRAGTACDLEPLRIDGIDAGDAGDVDAGDAGQGPHECVDIAPLGGRLLAFWSDTMVHGVLPSQAACEAEYRWALTIWLHTDDPQAIAFDEAMEARHFAGLQGGHRQLAG